MRRPARVPVVFSQLVAVLLAGAAAGFVESAVVTPPSAAAAPCWRPPVDAPVVDPFRRPPCRWCAGNRGIEYAPVAGRPVRAVAAGRVTFSGAVAGTRYVVVEVAGGWLVTYGRLARTTVRRGDVVAARAIVGTAADQLFFGLRIDGRYTDPARYLGRWVGRPRLVPLHGGDRRPTPARWRCGG